MTRAECEARYGKIDFEKRIWPGRDRWMHTLEIDSTMFPNFYVANTKVPVKRIYVNVDMVQPLHLALMEVESKGMAKLLHSFDGSFNIRMTRGSTSHFSAHSYGMAIDLNAAENPLGATSGGFFNQPDLVKCFTNHGFVWGGSWKSRADAMHFSMTSF